MITVSAEFKYVLINNTCLLLGMENKMAVEIKHQGWGF